MYQGKFSHWFSAHQSHLENQQPKTPNHVHTQRPFFARYIRTAKNTQINTPSL